MKKLLLLLVFMIGVSASAQKRFVKSSENQWITIPMKSSIDQAEAWNKVVDLMSEDFEISFLDNDSKYLRTGWIAGWGGLKSWYVVRASVKFSLDGKSIRVKSEAKRKGKVGYDEGLLSTLKTDIGGVVGRVAR